ncbi:unnamed protein product [Ectocarpus fasciculatus]
MKLPVVFTGGSHGVGRISPLHVQVGRMAQSHWSSYSGVSMYIALLLKVDVSDERVRSQRVFEIVLVAAHACMILAVVTETLVLAWSFKVEQREEQVTRFCPWEVVSSGCFLREEVWCGSSGVRSFFSRFVLFRAEASPVH